MRACSTAGGGVMFVPDTLKRKKTDQPVSYTDLLGDADAKSADEPAKKKNMVWSWVQRKKRAHKKAA